jgi:hypothetical protein
VHPLEAQATLILHRYALSALVAMKGASPPSAKAPTEPCSRGREDNFERKKEMEKKGLIHRIELNDLIATCNN